MPLLLLLLLLPPVLTSPHHLHPTLQAHFGRMPLAGDLALDQRVVVRDAVRLLQAAVDVIATSGWLQPALAAMEMSQMVAQGMSEKDSVLMQVSGSAGEAAAPVACLPACLVASSLHAGSVLAAH